jgi:hypothetical protein
MKKIFLTFSIVTMFLIASLPLVSCSSGSIDDALPNWETIEIIGPTSVNTTSYFEYASSKRQARWTYSWTVNNGGIVSGNGTASIFVEFWYQGQSAEIQLTVYDENNQPIGFASKLINRVL